MRLVCARLKEQKRSMCDDEQEDNKNMKWVAQEVAYQ